MPKWTLLRYPPAGTRKGVPIPFGGMRQDLDPAMVPDREAVTINGFRLDKGILDGRNIGTGADICGAARAFEDYRAVRFRSQQGQVYKLTFTSGGKISYSASDFGEASVKYVQRADGTDLILETSDGTNLLTGAPHILPRFIDRGKDVLVSNGVDDVYRIDGSTWSGSGNLRAVAVSTIPPFVAGGFIYGRTLVFDGDFIRISSPFDPDRFFSTIQERNAEPRIYDDNQWWAPTVPGVSGYGTNMVHFGGGDYMVVTTAGIFWFGLEVTGAGTIEGNIEPILPGVGCPSGACCMAGGSFYFLTDHDGGGIWRIRRRSQSAREAGGEAVPLDTDKEGGWEAESVGGGISDELGQIPASNYKAMSWGVDTAADYKAVAAGQREGIDCDTDPGTIFINAKSNIAFTVADLRISGTRGENLMGTWKLAAAWDTTYGSAKIHDSDPDWGQEQAGYANENNYGKIALTALEPTTDFRMHVALTSLKQKCNGRTVGICHKPNGWQHFDLDDIERDVSRVTIVFIIHMIGVGSGVGGSYTYHVELPLDLGGSYNVSALRLFDVQLDRTTRTIKIGEVRVEGTQTLSAWWIGDVGLIKGLTASSNLDFGRLATTYRQINDQYYPKIYYRAGKSATLDQLATGTLLASGVAAGATGFTLSAALHADAAIGDTVYFSQGANSETVYIKAISTDRKTITICGTFANSYTTAATLTVRGSISTSTNWTSWRLLTLAEMKQGLKLNQLNFAGGADLVTDSSGRLWEQLKVQLDVDPGTMLSTSVDWIFARFYGGTLKLSNHFMAPGPGSTILLSAPRNSGSAENDCTYWLHENGAWTTPGQRLSALVKEGSHWLANTGRKWGKLWEGNYNYVYNATAGTTSDTALLRKWARRIYAGAQFYLRKLWAMVNYFWPSGSLDATLTNTKFDAATAYLGGSQNLAPTCNLGLKREIRAKDGYLYYLQVDTATNASLYLKKIDPTTGEPVASWTIESRTTNYPQYGISMVEDAEGDNLLIAWVGYKTADGASPNRRLSFAVFNFDSQTVTTNTEIYTAVSGVYYYYPCLEVAANGDIYLSFATSVSGTYAMKCVRSIDGGVNWTVPISFAPPSNYPYTTQLLRDGSGEIFYLYMLSSGGTLYYRKIANAIIGDETVQTPPTGYSYGKATLARAADDVYLVARTSEASNNMRVYKYAGGTFSPAAAATSASGSAPAAVVAFSNGNLLVTYLGSTAFKYCCIIGQNDSWSAEADLLTSDAIISISMLSAARRDNDEIYLVGGYTDDGVAGYRAFKTELSEISGSASTLDLYLTRDGTDKQLAAQAGEAITMPQVFPDSENPGDLGQFTYADIEIQTYGQAEIGSLGAVIETPRRRL